MTIKVPSTLADELESKMRARQACKTEAAADTFTHEIGLLICGEPEAILTALRASPVIDREAVLEKAARVVAGKQHSRPDTPFLVAWNQAVESCFAAIRALKSPVGDDRGLDEQG